MVGRRRQRNDLGRSVALALAGGLAVAGALEAAEPAPQAGQFPGHPLQVHIAKGLWWDVYRVHHAGAVAGGARYTASYGRSSGADVGFPRSDEELMRRHVIVIANNHANSFVDPAARGDDDRSQSAKAAIAGMGRWVERGGGLLTLGGPRAFGGGQYDDSAYGFEALLPVDVAPGHDFKEAPAGAVLVPTEAGRKFFGPDVPWEQKPRLYYFHDPVALKPGAEVLLEAGGKPVLVRGHLGKGRVAVFTGSVCGMAAEGEIPLWEWDGWPQVLGRTIAWLGEPALAAGAGRPERAAGEDEGTSARRARLRSLGELDMDSLLGEDDGFGDGGLDIGGAGEKSVIEQIIDLARGCPSREYALDVVRTVVESETSFEANAAESLYGELARHVAGAGFVELGWTLEGTGRSGPVCLGLRLLGKCRAEKAEAALIEYVAGGLTRLKTEARAPQDVMTQAMAPPTGEDDKLRLYALLALGDHGGSGVTPALRSAFDQWMASKALRRNSGIAAVDPRLHGHLTDELARMLVFARMGDADALAELLKTLERGQLKLEYCLNLFGYGGKEPYIPEAKEKAREVYADWLNINRDVREALWSLPPSHLLSLAKNAGRLKGRFTLRSDPAVGEGLVWETDDANLHFMPKDLQETLARRDASPDSEPLLEAFLAFVEHCGMAEVRDLCAARIRMSGDEARMAALADRIVDLGRSPDEHDVLYALSQIAHLEPAKRVAVVRAARERPGAKIALKCSHAAAMLPAAERAERLTKE